MEKPYPAEGPDFFAKRLTLDLPTINFMVCLFQRAARIVEDAAKNLAPISPIKLQGENLLFCQVF